MYYEINICYNGFHFFATHERSITNPWELYKVLKVLKEKFPEEEGYEISVTRYETRGIPINTVEFLIDCEHDIDNF